MLSRQSAGTGWVETPLRLEGENVIHTHKSRVESVSGRFGQARLQHPSYDVSMMVKKGLLRAGDVTTFTVSCETQVVGANAPGLCPPPGCEKKKR